MEVSRKKKSKFFNANQFSIGENGFCLVAAMIIWKFFFSTISLHNFSHLNDMCTLSISKFELFPKVWIESIVIPKLSQWLINFNQTVRREFSICRSFYDLWWLTRWRLVNEIMIKNVHPKYLFISISTHNQICSVEIHLYYLWSLSWATPPSVEKWMNFSFNGCKNSNVV